MAAPPGCTAAKRGHSSPSGAAKCAACRRAKVPNIIGASVPMTPERWRVAKVTSLGRRYCESAAKDLNTDPLVLRHLSRSRDMWTRVYVGANTSTPPETLANMGLDDHDSMVVSAVLGNRSLSDEDFAIVATRCIGEDAEPSLLNDHPRLSETAYSSRDKRICRRLGVDKGNVDAIESLAEQNWWEMTPESDEVFAALTLSQNIES